MAERSDPRLKISALQRFGLGARLSRAELMVGDMRERLLAEIRVDGALQPAGASFSGAAPIGRALYAFEDRERAERESRRVAGQGMASQGVQVAAATPGPGRPQGQMQPPAPPAELPFPAKVYREEVRARMQCALEAEAGFAERLVTFWSNHFCVSVAKGNFVRAMAGAFEREAIRPHVFGRFEDLLVAVERHPAMLNFLDNQLSIGPDSRAGKRRGRGLNENLAREILELHTLGVSGGYSQADVTSLARIVTDWTVVGRDARLGFPGSFAFNPGLHDPGGQKLLGRVYRQQGREQGLAALADLARHPSTANFVARKLARHFVADEPPPALVAELGRIFRETQGDLAAVSRALIESDIAWTAPATKIRTPQDFLIAAFRALGRQPDFGQIAGPLIATVVMVVTEFGRTARVNGTVGTDHGTGTVAFLVGGAVKGGRMIADWPGLKPSQLHEQRDLRPTTDLRAVAKGVVAELFGLSGPVLAEKVFPGTGGFGPMPGLVG